MKIQNFKSIQEMEINNIENALILVGKNNTGKTSAMDALRIVSGEHQVKKHEYLSCDQSIRITIGLELDSSYLQRLFTRGVISKDKNYDGWYAEFCQKLPSYQEEILTFECVVTPDGRVKYKDGYSKNNPYIPLVFPKIYYIDHSRNLETLQNDVLSFYDNDDLHLLAENKCMFDEARPCNSCFDCIGLINQKNPSELSLHEIVRLAQHKIFLSNLESFTEKVNRYFHANGSPSQDIAYNINFDVKSLAHIEAQVYNRERNTAGSIHMLSDGIKNIYALSLLEAYIDEEQSLPCIIMMEDPEICLHPQLQKVASEILYRLSKKNQVLFSTHSPNMIFNFSSKQIRQIVLDENYFTVAKEQTDIDEILDDLGYTANDLMNVSFVFIVEGKQDYNRLPLLLEKYYSEIYDEEGNLARISIIPVNSCTNIKTYANLKYINKLYLKDQFLMIRDSDGKNPKYLKKQLCSYYKQRSKEDVGNLPAVTEKNVLILKYYSFENYFLDPDVMVKIGVLKHKEDFYNILYRKFKDYLYKLGSVKRMTKATGLRINSKQDLKDNMETIKIYVRGHNLYDIFYGKYRGERETEILKAYIDAAPKETFKDIFDAIDSFVYFENRRK